MANFDEIEDTAEIIEELEDDFASTTSSTSTATIKQIVETLPVESPKLSKEEEKKYLKEQKKILKEQKKLAKTQQQFRDFLTREKTFSKISHERGAEDWEKWWRQVGSDEFQGDLKTVAQSLNCLMDRSDHVVETIKTHRTHADEQYLRNFVKHSELIDYIFDLYKLFCDASNQMYETEREKLVFDFYDENYKRDVLLHTRKTNFENFVNAATSLTKSRIQETTEHSTEHQVEIESESFIKREKQMKNAAKREATACWEIRNLVKFFNQELWPKNRMIDYQQTLAKQIEADKVIDTVMKKCEKAESEIEKMNEELKILTHNQLKKETNLKSELKFMTKLLLTGQHNKKVEETSDFEKIKHLATICDKNKKILREKIERGQKIEAALKVCSKFEKVSDELESCDNLNCIESSENIAKSFEKLNENFDGKVVNTESSDDLASFESYYKFKNTQEVPTDLTKHFFRKLSKVETDCVILRRYKQEQTKLTDHLMSEIKEQKHKFEVQRNIQMLRLNSTPSIGEIHQISHQIPQLKTSLKNSKKFKLCKHCRDFYGNL